jgi:hypothetical protein
LQIAVVLVFRIVLVAQLQQYVLGQRFHKAHGSIHLVSPGVVVHLLEGLPGLQTDQKISILVW